MKCKIFLQMNMQSFLYENMTNILQANLMQVPCKCKMQAMHNDEKIKNKIVFFELNEIKSKSMTLQPPDSSSTTRKHPITAPR